MRILTALGALLFLSFPLFSQAAFINEINYATADPQGRGVEIVAEAGSDLDGWSLLVYTAAGAISKAIELGDAVIPNQQNGYGTVWYEVVQHDGGGGVGLTDPSGALVQFLSYGQATVLTAVNGIHQGTVAEYIGSTPAGGVLTLVGIGNTADDFAWIPTLLASPGSINTDQVFLLLMGKSTSTVTTSARSVPNPVVDQFITYFDAPLQQRGTLTVYDMRGVLLSQTQLVPGQSQAQLSLGTLPAGTYVLRFRSGKEQWTELLQH